VTIDPLLLPKLTDRASEFQVLLRRPTRTMTGTTLSLLFWSSDGPERAFHDGWYLEAGRGDDEDLEGIERNEGTATRLIADRKFGCR